jgi:hypothetical protein
MRAIDKFIIHVTHNLFPLNEYSEKEINFLMAQFKEEADDLDINISDTQLRAYIERFDTLKNSPKVTEKELRKYSLSKLIKLVTASKGAEGIPDEIEDTPDVVYNEGGITIWNGSKADNCIKYGKGERWCITKGSFGNYRYSENKGYPVFYLAKNSALPDSNKLSFVAIQVRDTPEENERYVYTNRNNSPYESPSMSFSTLLSEIPWLNDIPNIKGILKYIPLSGAEKLTQKYNYEIATIRDWLKFPFNIKEQYLVVKKGKSSIFGDITNDEFVSKYLPQFPQLAVFVAKNYGIIDSVILLKHLDLFPPSERKSITANLQDKISLSYLPTEVIPFDVKKLLVTLNKWEVSNIDRLYITKDGSTIVKLTLGDDIKVSLYQAEDDYPNVKLNKRTSRFLLDYPELDKIPFRNLIRLAGDDIISKDVITKLIDSAKTDPNSAIVVKQIENGEIVLDSNSFSSYKIDKNGGIVPLPFDDEDVQKVFAEMKDNTGFQESAINLLSQKGDIPIPTSIDKNALLSIVKSTPYSVRTKQIDGELSVLLTSDEGNNTFMWASVIPSSRSYKPVLSFGTSSGNWRLPSSYNNPSIPYYQSYFTYLRSEGKSFNEEVLLGILRSNTNAATKKEFVRLDPPIDPTCKYTPKVYLETAYLVNRTNPRESLKISDTGKLVKANITPANAATILGRALPATQAAPAAGGRGRPAGQPNVPRAVQPAAAAAGDINVQEVMDETGLLTAFLRLPRSILRRLNVTNASRVAPNGDRGAARRNNQLGNRGNVGRVIAIGSSKIYIIRLASGQIIASINVQPGNSNYVLTGNADGNVAISLNSPSELVSALTNRGLAEHRSYIVREYVAQNPRHLDEVRSMIQQHISETKKS